MTELQAGRQRSRGSISERGKIFFSSGHRNRTWGPSILNMNGQKGNRYRYSLRAGRFGDRIPVAARVSAPIQTGPGAYPASYTMGTGSFPEVKWPGHGVDHPPHLAPSLKKEQSYTSTPPLGLRGLFQGELYFRRAVFIRVKGRGVKLTSYLHLLLRLILSGVEQFMFSYCSSTYSYCCLCILRCSYPD